MLATETTLIWNTEYTVVYWFVSTNQYNTAANFIFSVCFIGGMTLNCLFTIFNLKMSDYLQLKVKQTDCIQMASITGLCAKIINVICFNYMFICGEILPNFEEWKHHTSFANFYGSMIKLEFFGKWYNVIAPLLILVIGLIFSVMGVFKYNSKTVEGIILYN